jgi:hypothetical protein
MIVITTMIMTKIMIMIMIVIMILDNFDFSCDSGHDFDGVQYGNMCVGN